MTVYPVELKRTDDRHIEIVWSDDFQQRTSYRKLRDHCPCASCRKPDDPTESGSAKKAAAGLRVLSAAETRPLEILSMSPVGNYAYNVQFSDGHNTGIFTFDLLRSLGANDAPSSD